MEAFTTVIRGPISAPFLKLRSIRYRLSFFHPQGQRKEPQQGQEGVACVASATTAATATTAAARGFSGRDREVDGLGKGPVLAVHAGKRHVHLGLHRNVLDAVGRIERLGLDLVGGSVPGEGELGCVQFCGVEVERDAGDLEVLENRSDRRFERQGQRVL